MGETVCVGTCTYILKHNLEGCAANMMFRARKKTLLVSPPSHTIVCVLTARTGVRPHNQDKKFYDLTRNGFHRFTDIYLYNYVYIFMTIIQTNLTNPKHLERRIIKKG